MGSYLPLADHYVAGKSTFSDGAIGVGPVISKCCGSHTIDLSKNITILAFSARVNVRSNSNMITNFEAFNI